MSLFILGAAVGLLLGVVVGQISATIQHRARQEGRR